jgi:hypothetical protein
VVAIQEIGSALPPKPRVTIEIVTHSKSREVKACIAVCAAMHVFFFRSESISTKFASAPGLIGDHVDMKYAEAIGSLRR